MKTETYLINPIALDISDDHRIIFTKPFLQKWFEQELKRRYEEKEIYCVTGFDPKPNSVTTPGILKVFIPRKTEQSTSSDWDKISDTME